MTVAGWSRETDAADDAVLGVARALASSRDDLGAAFNGAARSLATTLGDVALIALLSQDGGGVESAALVGVGGGGADGPSAVSDLATPPIDAAVLAGRLGGGRMARWASGDDHEDAELARSLFGAAASVDIRALLAVSLCADDAPVGLVAVARRAPERPYSDADADAIREVADQLGAAVELARLRERVQTLEDALRASEARYGLLSAATFEGVTIHERGRHVDTNEALSAMLGYTRDEIVEKTAWDLAAPESRSVIQQHIASHSDEPYEIVGIRKDGARLDLEVRGRSLRHEGRHLRVAAIRDVTDRKAVERALRESHDQLDVILRGVTDGIMAQTPDGRLVYANDAAAHLLGLRSAEALLAAPLADALRRFSILDDGGWPASIERLPSVRARAGERVVAEGVRLCARDTGAERWLLVSSTPVRDDHGAIQLAITIARDVTEAKRSEARLRFLAEAGALLPSSLSVRETLAQIAQVAAATLADWSAAYVVGPDETVERVAVAVGNPRQEELAQALLGHPSSKPSTGSELWRALRSDEPELIAETSDEMLVRGAWDEEHLRLLRELGVSSALWVPLIARGRTVGALSLFTAGRWRRFSRDDLALAVEMGRRAALAVDNARLYEEARAAITARDVFLSIASHELRTPVTVLKGTAQMLGRAHRRGVLDDARLDRSLHALTDASDRLAELTDDLLDVSRLRTDQIALASEPLDLGQFVRDVAERYRDHLTDRHTLRLETTVVPVVRADRRRLEQVVVNLLTNAVKYSPDGGELRLRVRRADHGVLLEVQDEGIGLPPGAAASIFEPFGRAPNAAERQIPGMGLGLHIARGIVERHDGRIWAESPGPGRGTTLRVWLPAAADELQPAQLHADPIP